MGKSKRVYFLKERYNSKKRLAHLSRCEGIHCPSYFHIHLSQDCEILLVNVVSTHCLLLWAILKLRSIRIWNTDAYIFYFFYCTDYCKAISVILYLDNYSAWKPTNLAISVFFIAHHSFNQKCKENALVPCSEQRQVLLEFNSFSWHQGICVTYSVALTKDACMPMIDKRSQLGIYVCIFGLKIIFSFNEKNSITMILAFTDTKTIKKNISIVMIINFLVNYTE